MVLHKRNHIQKSQYRILVYTMFKIMQNLSTATDSGGPFFWEWIQGTENVF